MTHRFGGKVALAAGADGGIGGAVAERLAEDGATVAAGVRPPDSAEPLDADWDAIELDVTDPAAAVRAVEGIVERHGDHDLLVGAAGPMPLRPLAETEPEDWRGTLDADLIGPFVLIRGMLCRGRPGAAVDLASIHAFAVEAATAIYAASKGALVSPTRSVALEGACGEPSLTTLSFAPRWNGVRFDADAQAAQVRPPRAESLALVRKAAATV